MTFVGTIPVIRGHHFRSVRSLHVDNAGKYKVEFIGAIDDSPNDASDVSERYVEDAIGSLLAGSKPKITEKRAIGCTIKWKS